MLCDIPFGYKPRYKCLYALAEGDLSTKLDYVESRKRIYIPLYKEAVRAEPKFHQLVDKLR